MKIKKLIILLFLMISLSINLNAHEVINKKKILILHSYHAKYQWTLNINNGINDFFDNINNPYEIKVEYMDVLQKNNEKQFELLFDLYEYKYNNIHFDCIICSDNYALNFLVNNRNKIFTNVPIIFCGINNFNENMLHNDKNITGITEDIDLEDTIDLIFKFHKSLKSIVIWSLGHTNADKTRERAVNYIKSKKKKVKIIHLRDVTLKEGIPQINKLSKKDIILLASVLRDENKEIIPVDITAKIITSNTEAPVYSFFDFFLGYGIVGGKLISGYEQGKKAAEFANELLTGTDIKNIKILKKSPNKYLFDYEMLKKYKIPLKKIPLNSTLINYNVNYFVKNKYLLIIFIPLIMFLILIILFLVIIILKRQQREYILQMERDSLFNVSIDMMCIADFNGYFKQLNPAWTKILGWSSKELMSNPWLSFVHPDDKKKTIKAGEKLRNNKPINNLENRYKCKNGTYKWLLWNSRPDVKHKCIYAVARDFTERKNIEQKLIEYAITDPLTGVYNRRKFFIDSGNEFKRFKRYKKKLSLMMIDIDHFKKINDKYGHQFGDQILKNLVSILKNNVRDIDTIGRYGGEEFIILLPESDINNALIIAERLQKEIRENTINHQNKKIRYKVSIGITYAKNDDHNIDIIIKRADDALYKAKENGRNRIEILN